MPWEAGGARPRVAALQVLPDHRTGGAEVMAGLVADPSGASATAFLAENYALMPSSFAPGLRALFEAIIDRRELPVLLCCREGKDRTGFVVSILLAALGVEAGEIRDEYLRSAPHFAAAEVAAALAAHVVDGSDGPSDAVLRAMQVHLTYLTAAFDAIDDEYGGIAAYLEDAGGLDELRRRQLQGLILEGSER
jgi:protein-tyrosine phosphatase